MKVGIFLIIILGVFLIGCNSADKPIGGERDEHGCLGPAGYTWDDNVGACIRDWELNDNQKLAATIAVDHVGKETGLTIIDVQVARCPGCFVVEVEKGKDRIKVSLEDWEIMDTSLTPKECEALGGRAVNTVGGDKCESYEEDIGDVTGFISPNICCVQFGGCTEDARICPDGSSVGRIGPGCDFKPCPGEAINAREAITIALTSECQEMGSLTNPFYYNENSKTWWIDLDMKEEFRKEGCNPACVVSDATDTAEINWRCTGVIE